MDDAAQKLSPAVVSVLERVGPKWSAIPELTSLEQRALFLLVAAGLVERRAMVRVAVAGSSDWIDATFAFTGEQGGMQSLEAVITEIWARWGQLYESWRRDTGASPFRVTSKGAGEWRLTEHGVEARRDLADTAPNATFGRGYVLNFVLRTGSQLMRDSVIGHGHLVELKRGSEGERPPAAPSVHVENVQQLAKATGLEIAEALKAAFQGLAPPVPNGEPDRESDECAHAPDFTWVVWFGERFNFSVGQQASAVEELWKQWEDSRRRDGCGLADTRLAFLIGAAERNFRLSSVFRDHPAYGTVIRRVGKGVHALFKPAAKSESPTGGDKSREVIRKGRSPKKK